MPLRGAICLLLATHVLLSGTAGGSPGHSAERDGAGDGTSRSSVYTMPAGFLDRVQLEKLRGWVLALQSLGTRYVYSDKAMEAADYILKELQGMGVPASLQTFLYNGHYISNVVAELHGRGPSLPAFVLCAHYDSINGTESQFNPYAPAPGADDDATGVAAVLGAAQALSRARTNHTVIFAFFTGEEIGRVGSSEFVRRLVESGTQIAGAICLDMIGYNHEFPKVDIVSNERSLWLAGAAKKANYYGGVGLRARSVVTSDDPPRWSDHVSFWERGIDAICLIEDENPTENSRYFRANPYYHSAEDTLEKLNLSLMVRIARLGLATAAGLASLALPDLRPQLLSYPSAGILEGDELWFDIRMVNEGEAIDKGSVSLLVDGVEVDRAEVNLSRGEAQLHWRATAGAHELRFVADPEDDFAEWDEANNALAIPLHIAWRPDLLVSELRADDTTPLPGQPLRIWAEVRNEGGAPASARLTLSSSSEGTNPLLNESFTLSAGGARIFMAVALAPDAEETFTATVCDADPYEADVSDNRRSLTVEPHLLSSSGLLLKATPDVADPGEPVTLEVETGPSGAQIRGFLFDFGDGTRAGWLGAPFAPHVYTVPGVHLARARVRDGKGAETELGPLPVTIREVKPVALARLENDAPGINESVGLSASASFDPDGEIVQYLWEFSDGARSLGKEVRHKFRTAGSHTVRLTVVDDRGNANFTEIQILVVNRPPSAVIRIDQSALFTGEEVGIDGLSSSDSEGNIVSWCWELGDGNTSSGPSLTHAYALPGTYRLRLTVRDELGAEGSAELLLRVFERPPQPPPVEEAAPPWVTPTAALLMLAAGGVLLATELRKERKKLKAPATRKKNRAFTLLLLNHRQGPKGL